MEGNPGRAPRLVGVVVNCLDLTIRKSPGNEAEVTGHLSVLVDMDKSTEDFYRVLARNGIAGFCPKKYVAIRR